MNVFSMFQKAKEEPKTTVKVHRIGARFNMDIGDERLHILNEKSLIWNLKRFGCDHEDIASAFEHLNSKDSYVEFDLEDVA